jgi:fumarate reductase subunit C
MTNLDKIMNPLVIAAALVAYFAFRFHRLAWFAARLHIAPKSWNRWIFGRAPDQKPH